MRALILVLALCSTALGQIVVEPSEALPYVPVVATATATMPEGATFKGGWEVDLDLPVKDRAHFIAVPNSASIHVWAKPGKHTLKFVGYWKLLGPEISVKDIHGEIHTFRPWLDDDKINIKGEFTVLGGDEPDPPFPEGPKQIVMFYDSEMWDDLPTAQRNLMQSDLYREQWEGQGHIFQQLVEKAAIRADVTGKLRPFILSVMNDPLPRVALAPVEGGTVEDFALPVDKATFDLLLGE